MPGPVAVEEGTFRVTCTLCLLDVTAESSEVADTLAAEHLAEAHPDVES